MHVDIYTCKVYMPCMLRLELFVPKAIFNVVDSQALCIHFEYILLSPKFDSYVSIVVLIIRNSSLYQSCSQLWMVAARDVFRHMLLSSGGN